jgi:predicted transposase YdaD
MTRHDRSYRQFFSQPAMVASLLVDLLGPAVTGPLDVSSLERVPDSFVGPLLSARQADMLWRLCRPDGRVVYVLLEFQSNVQRFMPCRILTYGGLIQQALIDRRQLLPGDLLPEILPIVFYNGRGRWGQPTEVAALIAAGPRPGPHVPRLRFLLVDVGSYSTRRLTRIAGPIGVLLLLERSRTIAELQRGVELLAERLKRPEDAALLRSFVTWIQFVLMPDRGWADHEIPALRDLQELREMLEERVKEWNRQLIAKGRKEGRQEGREEGLEKGRALGRREGEVDLLLRQLARKFGPLDEPTVARVRAARATQRQTWAERLLTAATLAEVFLRRRAAG